MTFMPIRSLLPLLAAPLLYGASWKEGDVRASDGARLHYLESGSGPPIVLQPGWTMPAEIWEPQLRGLSTRFRVVALDPRSQGKSERVPDGHYAERRAQDIREVAEALKLGPIVLAGWSLGVGEVLTYVAQYGTSSLRGLVLVDGEVGRDPDAQRTQAVLGMLRSLQTNRDAWGARFVRSMYKQPQSEEYLGRITAAARSVPTNTAFTLIANAFLSGKDLRPVLKAVDKPLLVVAAPGTQSQAEMVKRLHPAARVEIFAEAGHALFVDEAERFNRVLAEFASALP